MYVYYFFARHYHLYSHYGYVLVLNLFEADKKLYNYVYML